MRNEHVEQRERERVQIHSIFRTSFIHNTINLGTITFDGSWRRKGAYVIQFI